MPNIKQGKIWGETSPLFKKNNVSLHRIDILPGGYCSKHLHKHRHNIFYVLEGQITVRIWKTEYDLIDFTVLEKGDMLDVAPGEYHKFENKTDKPAVALEIYYTELNESDIVRETVGGINSHDTSR